MINKKRQELIIQNLNSISAEVRIKSMEQLVQLPQFPDSEKSKLLQRLVQDADDDVKRVAQELLQKLSGLSTPGSQPAAVRQPPVIIDNSSSRTEADLPSMLPSAAVLDSPEEPLPPPVSMPPQQPVLQQIHQSAPPPVSTPLPKPLPSVFVDDPLDPSLPDLKKITDIPALFQHIKMLADKKPSGYLTQLLQLARSVMEEVALTALQSLLNLKEPRIASQILAMLADEQYSSQRRFLMLKIILDSDQELDSALIQEILLREKDVIVKSGLVKVFARSSRESGVPTLILCLEDQDPRVRANTVEVIEEQAIRGCEQKIIQLLNDPENRVKVNAAKYLVKNGYQQAFLTLRAMLVSPEVWLRDSVIFALGEIGDQASLTLLKAALKDPNQGIRLSVLKALARINNNTSRQVLKAACGDPDPVVAQVANSLFEKIKDTPMREEVKQIQPAVPVAPIPQAPVARPVPPVVPVSPPPVPSLPTIEQSEISQVEPSLPSVEETMRPVIPAAQPVQRSSISVPPPLTAPVRPPITNPVKPPPASLAKPVMPVNNPASAPVILPAGSPVFAKPRSAEIYARLTSADVNEQRAGARDIAFVMGDDQMILLARAVALADESIRIAALKLLSRKKTPEVRDILQNLTSDPNETVRSLAEKALLLLK